MKGQWNLNYFNLLFVSLFFFGYGCSQKKDLPSAVDMENFQDTVSYSIGADIGENLKRQNIEINYGVLITGILDAYETEDIKIDQKTRRNAMMKMQQSLREKDNKNTKVNLKESEDFLKKNKDSNKNIVETSSGLQYRIIKKGSGKSPKATDKVRVHYSGRLINGNEFDSSISRGKPAEFQLNRVIRGWTEGLQLMNEGAKFEFFIHPNLGYGDRNTPKIPPNSVLIFEVELIKVL